MAGNCSSVEAMEEMIKMLSQFQDIQREMERRLKQKYDEVGSEWNDIQYQNLGGVLSDIYTSLSNNYVQVSECITRIQLSKRSLEDYLQIRL